MKRISVLVLLMGCGDKSEEEEDGKDWSSADLSELSSGECPDLRTSGATVTFFSSGEERTVTTVFPTNQQPGMRVVFFYHGLLEAGSNPTNYMVGALDLQDMADDYNAVIVLPESPIWNLVGQQFHMWDVEDGTFDKDLTFFDDLRTCVANDFDIDLDKVVSTGFSGGSLFNTILLSNRSEHLAAVVEMSGGADIEIPIYENEFAPYSTPISSIPVLLISGGEEDIWGGGLINFEEATNTLEQRLVTDKKFVVRCRHSQGHTITMEAFNTAIEWLVNHEYGVDSPYVSGISDWADWCEISQ